MNRSGGCCVTVAALLFVAGLGALAEPCTITVQPGESIQAAIDTASPGDVICLAGGAWEENLVIEKGLNLRAAEIDLEPQAVIRSAREGWPVIRIESEKPIETTVQGLTITGAFGLCYQLEPEAICADGISIHGKATVTIEGSTISGNAVCGIRMGDSAQIAIDNSIIGSNNHGILMGESSQGTITNSTLSDNLYSIAMKDSTQATVVSNTISDNWYGIMMKDSTQATIESNTISNNRWSGVVMSDSSQVTVASNTISDNGLHGIAMGHSTRVTIAGNTISDNRWYGIVMRHSCQATIDNNAVNGNGAGIKVADSSQATITGNLTRSNGSFGVALLERPCFDTIWVFTGYVTGSENVGGGNTEGDYCPDALEFLFSEEGGELDRRE